MQIIGPLEIASLNKNTLRRQFTSFCFHLRASNSIFKIVEQLQSKKILIFWMKIVKNAIIQIFCHFNWINQNTVPQQFISFCFTAIRTRFQHHFQDNGTIALLVNFDLLDKLGKMW